MYTAAWKSSYLSGLALLRWNSERDRSSSSNMTKEPSGCCTLSSRGVERKRLSVSSESHISNDADRTDLMAPLISMSSIAVSTSMASFVPSRLIERNDLVSWLFLYFPSLRLR